MDSLTQVVLGAAVGQAALGKKVGNKALVWGAVVGTIPDLDIIFNQTHDMVTALDVHRGFSHSIVFSILAAPALGWLIAWLHKRKGEADWKQWTWLAFLCLITHPMLDNFTTWGTEFFWPFYDHKVAFHTIFVVDPLYTFPFLIMTVWLMFYKRDNPKRRRLNYISLWVSSAYLFVGIVNKSITNFHFEEAFAQNGVKVERFMNKPTPLNIVLWNAIAETDEAYYIGYSSILDEQGYRIPIMEIQKNHHLIDHLREDEKLNELLAFTKGYYTVVQESDSLWLINDMRFGMNRMVIDESADFIFKYKVTLQADGSLEFDRARSSLESMEDALGELWNRLKGRSANASQGAESRILRHI